MDPWASYAFTMLFLGMLWNQCAAHSGFTVRLPGHATEDVFAQCNDFLKVVSIMCVHPPPQHLTCEYKNYIILQLILLDQIKLHWAMLGYIRMF